MKTYKFWGADNSDTRPINNEYPGIESPKDLYIALSKIWCANTCAPRMRENWTRENMTLGQCSITAFLVQDIFGGQVFGIERTGGNYHCYNVIGDRKFDLTSEQFGEEILNYDNNPEQFRNVHFSKEEKFLRYNFLKEKLKNMCDKYKTPFSIKNVTFRNRIAVPPMVCFHWTDDGGYVTERNIAHYRELAEGGAGLIIVEATAITKRSRLHDTELGIWEDGQIDGLKKIADAIHENGSKAFIQLLHAGGNGIDLKADAPSSMPYYGGIEGVEMSKERIAETIEDFVKAALRAKAAGFDGVELHGCHGYLISCFSSSLKNVREDEYGQEKALFARNVLQAVKKACGEDYIVGIRFGIFEPTLKEGLENSKAVAPFADFIDASYGTECQGERTEDFPCSEAVYGAMKLKEMLPEMPVFGVHNINSIKDVVNALDTGIDMADVGKAQLVDPSFAKHIINGQEYGQCLHCNNYCRWNPNEMKNPNLRCPGYLRFHK